MPEDSLGSLLCGRLTWLPVCVGGVLHIWMPLTEVLLGAAVFSFCCSQTVALGVPRSLMKSFA